MRGSGQVLDDEIRNTGLQGRTDRLTPQGPQNSLPDTQSPKKKRNVHISSQIKHERFVLNLRAKKPPQVGGQGALGWGAHAAQGVEVTGRTPQSGHSRSPRWVRDSGAGAHAAQGVEGDGQGTLESGAQAAQDVEGVRGPSSSQKRRNGLRGHSP